MEILRNLNTTSITATFSVSTSGFYTLEYSDLLTEQTFSASATSSYGAVTFNLDERYLKYTGNLVATVKDSSQNITILTNIDIVRPYCDLDKIALGLNILDGSEKDYERIARYIIDSQTQGFSFVRKEKEIIGKGFDYLPVNEKIHKLYKVYENGELMYDSESENNRALYKLSTDKTSIVEFYPDTPENKMNYKHVWRDRYLDTDFAEGFEYLVDADFGYVVIPQDIQEACELLIQDMKTGSNKYINQYIESFDNEDFKIKFSQGAASQTGNKIVDNILKKYKNEIRLGVL
jgi:hypothetical protein